MLKTKFTKYSGAGNDFVVILSSDLKGMKLSENQVKQLCHRRYGVGSDGLIVISPSDVSDFEMEYYNSDGKPGSLCGNGARCAIKHASVTGFFDTDFVEFIVGKDKYSGKVIDENIVQFNLNNPFKVKKSFKIKAYDQLVESAYADTGSPHVVINCRDVLRNPTDLKSGYRDLSDFPVFQLGSEIRHHRDFAPSGTNVNFIEILEDSISIRTFERGVEQETLACGTGSVAAALILKLKYDFNSPVTITTKGSDKLVVKFDYSGIEFSSISLTGPAEKIFDGEILL